MFLSSRGLRVLTDTTGWQGFVSSPCVAVARIPERNLQGGKIYLVRGFEGLVYVLGSVDSEPEHHTEKGVAHTMVGRKPRRCMVLDTVQPPRP